MKTDGTGRAHRGGRPRGQDAWPAARSSLFCSGPFHTGSESRAGQWALRCLLWEEAALTRFGRRMCDTTPVDLHGMQGTDLSRETVQGATSVTHALRAVVPSSRGRTAIERTEGSEESVCCGWAAAPRSEVLTPWLRLTLQGQGRFNLSGSVRG